MELIILFKLFGFDVSAWLAGSGMVVIAGMIVTFLRKKGLISAVKLFSKKMGIITQQIGEAFLESSDVFFEMDRAIKDDGTLIENSVKDVVKAGKEAVIEWEDVILMIKPKKK